MNAWGRWGTGLCLAGLLVGTGARAEEAKDEKRWAFRVEANTDFPLGAGARVGVISPWRVYLTTSVDALVPGYVQAGNALGTRVASSYTQQKADYIDHALRTSLAWRTHVGWQPSATSGFYIEAGYGLLALGGQTNVEDALITVLRLTPLEGEEALERQYRVRAQLHQLDLELGWRWKLGTAWSVRAGIGSTVTLDSNSHVEPRYEPSNSLAVEAFSRLAENKIDTYAEKYGYLPTLSLSVGYTF